MLPHLILLYTCLKPIIKFPVNLENTLPIHPVVEKYKRCKWPFFYVQNSQALFSSSFFLFVFLFFLICLGDAGLLDQRS